jgi:hypothetical protein
VARRRLVFGAEAGRGAGRAAGQVLGGPFALAHCLRRPGALMDWQFALQGVLPGRAQRACTAAMKVGAECVIV